MHSYKLSEGLIIIYVLTVLLSLLEVHNQILKSDIYKINLRL